MGDLPPTVASYIAQGGAALAALEAIVIVVLWREVKALRARIEELHEERLVEFGKSVEALSASKEANELLAEIAEERKGRKR